MARGDKGVNGLDELCKKHDIFYSQHPNSSERFEADKELSSGAAKRIFAKDASLGERAAALLVTGAMKIKTGLTKFGAGVSCMKRRKKRSKKISFAALVKDAKRGIKKSKAKTVSTAIKAALRSAKKTRKGKSVKVPRIIKVPSISGGILPLLPILAGLGAIGSVVGTATGVAKTIKDLKNAREYIDENKRHNKVMELKVGKGLSMVSKGGGLYLKPFRGGGLYLKPFSNSKNSK